ncbi:MAG: alkaline phosphatase family protein [Leptolyngbyaceae cyanobacterium MAG.088]|nr:alkaline phosphatase family protein [Leptolyngbyaceae cyanobacterium MAG.088]
MQEIFSAEAFGDFWDLYHSLISDNPILAVEDLIGLGDSASKEEVSVDGSTKTSLISFGELKLPVAPDYEPPVGMFSISSASNTEALYQFLVSDNSIPSIEFFVGLDDVVSSMKSSVDSLTARKSMDFAELSLPVSTDYDVSVETGLEASHHVDKNVLDTDVEGLAIASVLGTSTTLNAPDVQTEPLIIIALDALNPAYVNLDRYATGLGSEGDWLMPNLQGFREQSAYWENAKAWAPYVTDNNHLNAVAGTNPGLTGTYNVNFQAIEWGPRGVQTPDIHIANARYPDGTPVQTIFDLFETVTNGDATTAYIAGKDWVGDSYIANEENPDRNVVDFSVTGSRPRYQDPFGEPNYYDNPETDADAEWDPESRNQVRSSNLLNGNVDDGGAGGSHPSDHWIADEALQILRNDQPDVIYILMAQLDQSQHALGSLVINEDGLPEWDIGPRPRGIPDEVFEERYTYVNPVNNELYMEPIVDAIWDTDQAFGDLMAGIEQIKTDIPGYLDNANIVVLSDHNMVTHQDQGGLRGATSIKDILTDNGIDVSGRGALDVVSNGSTGYVFLRPDADISLIDQVDDILGDYTLVNPETGQSEVPWDIVTRDEMITGRPDLNLEPMELYHQYYADEGIWPHLFLFAKNGWQFPLEKEGRDFSGTLLKGAHGSNDSDDILMAIQGMGLPVGTYSSPVRISDIGTTAMEYYDLPIPYDGLVGNDLHDFLGGA